MRRTAKVLLVLGVVTGVSAGMAVPATASHPCNEEEPCESHWCFGPNLKPPFLFYEC